MQCPNCKTDMVFAAITPHQINPGMAKHEYRCAKCNLTKSYMLPAKGNASDFVGTPRLSLVTPTDPTAPRR